ncbi:MAG: glycosyltransferase, partial [Candidatus Hodarchaeales archaeon]
KDSLTNLVEIFNKIETDAVSGKTLAPENGNLLAIATGLEYEDRFDRMGENFVTVAATTCLGVKKDAYKKIGGFKDYSTGEATGEDWDFSKKFTDNGFKIFHSNRIRVHHNHKKDSIKKWFSRRIHHSGYRVTHKRKHDQIFEEYFSLPMFIETTFLLSIPVAMRMYKKSSKWQVLFLPVFAILRNFAWFLGVMKELVNPIDY